MQPNPRPALLAEVKAIGGHSAVVSELKAVASEGGAPGLALKHVDSPADRSAPMTDGANVGQVCTNGRCTGKGRRRGRGWMERWHRGG
jgi:hypothetical protein